jgi:cytochrome P450
MTPEEAWASAMAFENRPDPYPFFDELRKTPVVHVGDGIYVVTGYQELLELAHDPRISSDTRRLKAKASGTGADELSVYGEHGTMINADPPEHDKMRRQAMRHFGPPFSPDVIPAFGPVIQDLCTDSLNKVKASGKTRFDVVQDYAYPVPVAVICKLLGVPLEDEAKFHLWIHDAMAGVLTVTAGEKTEEVKALAAKGMAAMASFAQYTAGLIKKYIQEPADCMFSKLVNEDGPDGPMSEREAAMNANLLLIAGHDSTVNTIANTVMCALRTPGCIELLQSRRELIPGAVEESLRMQAAVQFFPSRSATDDIEIAGVTIPKGSPVHLMYGAANRDPKKFPDPNTYDPARRNNEHMGWGSGIHTCFGGPLARLEVNIAIETFLDRVENPRLVVDPPPYRQSSVFRGPEHLVIDCDGIKD